MTHPHLDTNELHYFPAVTFQAAVICEGEGGCIAGELEGGGYCGDWCVLNFFTVVRLCEIAFRNVTLVII